MHIVYRIKQLILILGDLGSFYIGLWVALALRHLSTPTLDYYIDHISPFFWIFLLWVVVNFINGILDLEKVRPTITFYRRVLESGFIAGLIGIAFFYIFRNTLVLTPKTILGLPVLFGYGCSVLWRQLYMYAFGKYKLQTNVLFIGYSKEVNDLLAVMKEQPERGYHCAAIVDPQIDKLEGYPEIDTYKQLKTIRPIISTKNIKMVVISPHLKQHEETLRELYELLFWSVQLTDLSGFYQVLTGRIPPSTFSEGWFLEHLRNQRQPGYTFLRRMVDYVAGTILLALLILFTPIVALAIKLSSKGPVFYSQDRIGEKGQRFRLHKFRSMYSLSDDGSAETDGVEFAKVNDERITAVGKVLRKTRIDEWPQAINLLRGDVTLIGPRPERPQIVRDLEERMPCYSLRHIIRPGITGWAQVHQHYTDNLETSLEKLQFDLFYIKNRSFLLDLSILLRTINVVFRMMGQ